MGSLCGIALYYLKKSETNETYTVLSATVKDKYIKDTEYWESCILVIGDYEFVVPEEIYSPFPEVRPIAIKDFLEAHVQGWLMCGTTRNGIWRTVQSYTDC